MFLKLMKLPIRMLGAAAGTSAAGSGGEKDYACLDLGAATGGLPSYKTSPSYYGDDLKLY